MAALVYVLCALTSVACAAMLFRRYHAARGPLLFWSTWCFVFFALTNVLLFMDLAVFRNIDMSLARSALSFAGFVTMLYGLIRQNT